MGIRNRLCAGAVAAAMLALLASTATVSAAPASPSSAAPSGDKKGADKKQGPDKDVVAAKVAAGLHVTVAQLVAAVDHLKQAMGSGTAKADAVAAFARELNVSVAHADKALRQLSAEGPRKPKPGKDKQPGVPEQAVTLLAAELHISVDRARQVFTDLDKVNGKDAVNDPAFIAIAKGLGITTQRLLAVLIKVKQESGGQPKEKVPGGSPTK